MQSYQFRPPLLTQLPTSVVAWRGQYMSVHWTKHPSPGMVQKCLTALLSHPQASTGPVPAYPGVRSVLLLCIIKSKQFKFPLILKAYWMNWDQLPSLSITCFSLLLCADVKDPFLSVTDNLILKFFYYSKIASIWNVSYLYSYC